MLVPALFSDTVCKHREHPCISQAQHIFSSFECSCSVRPVTWFRVAPGGIFYTPLCHSHWEVQIDIAYHCTGCWVCTAPCHLSVYKYTCIEYVRASIRRKTTRWNLKKAQTGTHHLSIVCQGKCSLSLSLSLSLIYVYIYILLCTRVCTCGQRLLTE